MTSHVATQNSNYRFETGHFWIYFFLFGMFVELENPNQSINQSDTWRCTRPAAFVHLPGAAVAGGDTAGSVLVVSSDSAVEPGDATLVARLLETTQEARRGREQRLQRLRGAKLKTT